MNAAVFDDAPERARTPHGRDFTYGAALVCVLHLALLAVWLGHTSAPRPVALTPPVIEAQLIAPAAAPEAKPVPGQVRSIAPPQPTVTHTQRTAPHTTAPMPAVATPQPLAAAADHPAVTAPPAAAIPPAGDTGATTAAATPPAAPQPATLPAGAPISVAHLECAIARPDYPALSRRNDESGSVLVQLVIDAQGRIQDALLHNSSGHPRLDQAALQAARDSRCRPYMQNGQAVPASAYVPFRFTLDD